MSRLVVQVLMLPIEVLPIELQIKVLPPLALRNLLLLVPGVPIKPQSVPLEETLIIIIIQVLLLQLHLLQRDLLIGLAGAGSLERFLILPEKNKKFK